MTLAATNPWTPDTLFSSKSIEWATPQALFDKLDTEFHFGMDGCAQGHNAKCDIFLSPVENSLTSDWGDIILPGSTVWLNPPWGRTIGTWLAKAVQEARDSDLVVVCLIPASTDTAWWHDYVMKAAQVRFIRGRLKFIRDDGHTGPCPKGAAVVVFTRWGLAGPPSFSTMDRV